MRYFTSIVSKPRARSMWDPLSHRFSSVVSKLGERTTWSTPSSRILIFVAASCMVLGTWTLAASRLRMPGELPNAEPMLSQHINRARTYAKSSEPQVIPIPAVRREPAASTMTVALGDQLKITFFERLEAWSETTTTGSKSRSVSLVEQTALTGDYVIQQSGHVLLPILGAIEALDLSIEKLADELIRAYSTIFHQDAKVSVVISDRSPIYVLGTGSKAGTFKFTPGMTVLHALALAGSSDDDRQDVYLQSELVRQKERHAVSKRRLEKGLALMNALRAELGGTSPELTARLTQIAGRKKADSLIETEIKIRRLLAQIKQSQLDGARGATATARRDIDAINKKLAILDQQIEVKNLRKDALSKLRDIRSANPFLSNQVAGEVFDAQERRQEVLLALSQAQRRLVDAEAELNRLAKTQQLELEKEITVAEQEVAHEETAMTSSERFIDELRMQAARSSLTSRSAFEIVRQTRNGPQRFPAEEMTELKSGDLIHVSNARPL